MKISVNLKNINSPAPRMYRKFENAFCVAISPAILTAIQGWGLSDSVANKCMIMLTLSVALVKGFGMILANGESYSATDPDVR